MKQLQCQLAIDDHQCEQPAVVECPMIDGGTVWLCRRHESWRAALAPVLSLDGDE